MADEASQESYGCQIALQVLSLPTMSESRRSFFAGLAAVLPIQIGVIPFGMIYGVVALDAGLTTVQTLAMSLIVFAGSAQFIMAQLFSTQAAMVVIILTAVMLNLRHILYSASISNYFNHLSMRRRMFLAYFLTDEAYAVAITKFQIGLETRQRHWYYLGAGVGLWAIWQVSTAAGIVIGERIPGSWPLGFFVVLTFIALVVPTIKDRSSILAALTAGAASVILLNLSFGLGLVVAAILGIAVGMVVDRRRTGDEEVEAGASP